MRLLLQNIRELVQTEEVPQELVAGKKMSKVGTVPNAFLLIHDELIEDFGPMRELNRISVDDDILMEIDCSGRLVYPAWCDPHTHLVYAGSREKEFVGRIKGQTYEQIAQNGGGILNSARLLHETPAEELYEQSVKRIFEIMRQGTGAIEIKSGYGLTTEDELKMLQVIQWIRQTTPLCVRATFLGAHAIPEAYKNNTAGYVDLIINEMIPQVAAEELADYIDVFCEKGFFSVEDTERILMAGIKYGLRPKIHANELGRTGGVQAGVKYNALSVDHLEHLGEEEIETLSGSETMPTLLPGASFFLNLPYAPARKMIDAGLPVALASDFNPGSSPSGNMNFIGSLACLKLKMTPQEAVNAATINAAYAMGVSDRLGSIARGKIANVFITRPIPSMEYFPYMFGSNLIETLILNGEIQSF
ncbi:MAG TPA: imidazolonepropionase [Prolixibacteraceae bacterium]|nr:imidazolonepropionase [Prolixibacteraceae bacterium]